MDGLLKWAFFLLPLIGQTIVQVQAQAGVNHPTLIGSIAGWLIAVTLAGRAVTAQTAKNVAAGSDTAGGGA